MAEAYDINDILGLDDSMDDSDQELTIADILGPNVSASEITIGRTPRQIKWLGFFLDRGNPQTFMNASASAREAGYEGEGAQSGMRNRRRFGKYIANWVDEEGLSPDALKQSLVALVNARDPKVRLPALGMAMKSRGMLIERKIIEGGDNPIRHSHEVVLSPEIQAKLGEIYGE